MVRKIASSSASYTFFLIDHLQHTPPYNLSYQVSDVSLFIASPFLIIRFSLSPHNRHSYSPTNTQLIFAQHTTALFLHAFILIDLHRNTFATNDLFTAVSTSSSLAIHNSFTDSCSCSFSCRFVYILSKIWSKSEASSPR